MDRIRIAVAGGGGGIGLGSHLPAIASLPQVELVAVCDANSRGLEQAVARYGGTPYSSLQDMLQREDIDLVDIATPDFLHAQNTIAAARTGKHVLCEKPMAMSLSEAAAMKAAVEQAGVKFMVAQCMRWFPEGIALKEACRSIGEPVFSAYHMKGRFFGYPAESFYRKRESLGQFVHNGMHYVDLMSWCVGSLPARVYAQSIGHYPTDDRLETDNYLVANVTYRSGATGVYELNQLMLDPPGYRGDTRWYVVGTEGTAEWRTDAGRHTEVFGAAGTSHVRTSPQEDGRDPFAAEIAHMADCILHAETPCIGMDWSIAVLATCLGALQSAQTGQVVDIETG